jgi:hypothetical protein
LWQCVRAARTQGSRPQPATSNASSDASPHAADFPRLKCTWVHAPSAVPCPCAQRVGAPAGAPWPEVWSLVCVWCVCVPAAASAPFPDGKLGARCVTLDGKHAERLLKKCAAPGTRNHVSCPCASDSAALRCTALCCRAAPCPVLAHAPHRPAQSALAGCSPPPFLKALRLRVVAAPTSGPCPPSLCACAPGAQTVVAAVKAALPHQGNAPILALLFDTTAADSQLREALLARWGLPCAKCVCRAPSVCQLGGGASLPVRPRSTCRHAVHACCARGGGGGAVQASSSGEPRASPGPEPRRAGVRRQAAAAPVSENGAVRHPAGGCAVQARPCSGPVRAT